MVLSIYIYYKKLKEKSLKADPNQTQIQTARKIKKENFVLFYLTKRKIVFSYICNFFLVYIL